MKQFMRETGKKRSAALNLLMSEVESGKLLTDRPLLNGPRYWWRNPDFVNSP